MCIYVHAYMCGDTVHPPTKQNQYGLMEVNLTRHGKVREGYACTAQGSICEKRQHELSFDLCERLPSPVMSEDEDTDFSVAQLKAIADITRGVLSDTQDTNQGAAEAEVGNSYNSGGTRSRSSDQGELGQGIQRGFSWKAIGSPETACQKANNEGPGSLEAVFLETTPEATQLNNRA